MKEKFPKSNLTPDKNFENKSKEGVDFVIKQHPELIKIGTKKEYSNYLNTIFPDSEIKSIVYHGDEKKGQKEQFYKKEGEIGSRSTVIFFSTDKKWAKTWAEGRDDNVTSALVNVKKQFNFDYLSQDDKNELVELSRQNILKKGLDENFAIKASKGILDELREGWWDTFNQPYLASFFNKRGYDSWREKEGQGYENLTIFRPEQIHILGSNVDMEKFKDFINKKR